MLFILSLFACTSPPDCPDPSVVAANNDSPASTAPKPGNAILEAWEAELLAKPLTAIRNGIQPFGKESFGICQGIQKCESFLGAEPGLLAEGDFLAFAELNVPNLGDGWAANFQLHCETTRPDGSTTPYDYDRRYEVRNSGPNRGYRLSPMMRIKSPHSAGPRSCTYTLTPIRPDGVEGEAWSGTYATP
jgi:hypothetical protein